MNFKSSKLFLSVMLLLFALTGNIYASEFPDVPDENVFSPYVQDLKDRGIINGYNDGSFKPNNPVTRGELSKFIVNAFELEGEDMVNNFNDLNEENVFYNYIITLNELEIVNGFSDGSFREQEYVNRGATTKFTVNSLSTIDSSKFRVYPDYQIFSDTPRGHTFLEHVNTIASVKLDDDARIINGYSSDSSFRPDNIITRAELAKVISLTLRYKEDGGVYSPLEEYITTQTPNPDDETFTGELNVITTYKINDNQTISPYEPNTNEYVTQVNEVWEIVKRIYPEEFRNELGKIGLFRDGPDNTLGAIYRDIEDLDKYTLVVDLDDIYANGSINLDLVEYISIHELGHIISLDETQLTITQSLYTARSEEEFLNRLEISKNLCKTFYPFDGCSKTDSYINQFFQNYWAGQRYDEWSEINSIENQDAQLNAMRDFYEKYYLEFVTAYGATDPSEDISESFAAFVIRDNKPNNNTVLISEKKILFFYNYPELINLREDIRANTTGTLQS